MVVSEVPDFTLGNRCEGNGLKGSFSMREYVWKGSQIVKCEEFGKMRVS